MTDLVASVHGVPIRLTDERWSHVVEEHTELAGMRLDVLETVANPERVLQGAAEELLAVREAEPGNGWWSCTDNCPTTVSSSQRS